MILLSSLNTLNRIDSCGTVLTAIKIRACLDEVLYFFHRKIAHFLLRVKALA